MDFPLSSKDKEFIRAIAPFFGNLRTRPSFTGIAKELGITRDEAVEIFHHLSALGLVRGGTNESFNVKPKVVALVHEWDNPPPRDHWKDLEIWFRSRRWSLPLVGIVILAPIIAQWVEWIYNGIVLFWAKKN